MAFLINRDRAPAAPVDDSTKDVHNALIALREAVESKNADTLRNVRRMLEEYEENTAQKTVREYVPERKRREAVQLAIAMGMPVRPDGGIDYAQTITMRDTPEYKTWFGWFSESRCHEIGTTRWGIKDLNLKTLRTDADPQGGYLIPQVMDAHIRKNITEISPVRRHARQRIAHSKVLDIPRRLSIPIAQYEGEAESAPTDQSIYGSEQVTCYRQTVNIPATLDMMISAAFDIENEIATDVAESFAQGEGLNFVKGNGRKGPQGILNDSRVVPYTSTNSGTINWDDFVNLSGQLKRGYEPWFYLNRRTLAAVQGLTSQIGVPIWMPVAGNQPATIWGFPYDSSFIDLDDSQTGSGAKPVLFADLWSGYEILDMLGMNATRDDLTRKRKRSPSGPSAVITPAASFSPKPSPS